MKPIKFRGKRADNGEWVYGHLFQTPIGEWKIKKGFRECLVKPDTIGQFTGLKDESGKEIYEGDIIDGCFKYDKLSADGAVIPDNDCLCKGVVKFSKDRLQWVLNIFWAESPIAKWMEEEEDSEIPLVHFEYESPEFNMDLLEVIGNTADNPEQIKTTQNE